VWDSLAERLQGIFRRLRGRGKLAERDVDEVLREVRLALLEADVHFQVARDLVARIRARAVGAEVLQSLTPAQQVIKIVHEELTRLMGGERKPLQFTGRPPYPVMLVGLQGSGKTTTAAKLAHLARARGLRPLLAAADTFRAAGSSQLQIWGERLGIETVGGAQGGDAAAVAFDALQAALARKADIVFVDTAGRMHTKRPLMEELGKLCRAMSKAVPGAPHESWLVLDAMLGNNALAQARTFQEALGLTGVVLAKLDGSGKAGFVFSIQRELGLPVRFVGLGEAADDLAPFVPGEFVTALLGAEDERNGATEHAREHGSGR